MNAEIKERVEMIQRGEAPKGYKKTKVGIIPEDWEVERLKNMGETYAGLSGKSKKDFGQGKPFIPYKNIFNNSKINTHALEYVNIEVCERQNKVKYGDIFFTTSSETPEEIGMSSVLLNEMEEVYLNSFCFGYRLEDFNILEPEFARYLFRSDLIRNVMIRLAQGSTRYNLSKKEVLKILIPIPSIIEQQKIAEILSTWDEAIELKEKLIEEKQEQKKGLMQNLLTGKVRLPGFEGEWEEVRLGEIVEERHETGYSHLELLAITSDRGIVKRTSVDIKDNSSADKSRYKRVVPLDIGYNTMRMWQGVSGVSEYEGIVSPAYTILKPVNEIDSYFIGYLFKLSSIINLFRRYSQGLVSDTLNLKYSNLKEIKVTIPKDLKEQKAIANILSTADREIELLKEEVELLKEQKKGLMQLLLTGIVRVKC